MSQALSITNIIEQAKYQQLAQDLAISPASVADICKAYELTEEQLAALAADKDFIATFHGIQAKIQADDTIAPQLRAREALLLSIPTLLALIQSGDTMNMDKISAVKTLASIAGADRKEKAQGGGNLGVQVNLHLPGIPTSSIKVVGGDSE